MLSPFSFNPATECGWSVNRTERHTTPVGLSIGLPTDFYAFILICHTIQITRLVLGSVPAIHAHRTLTKFLRGGEDRITDTSLPPYGYAYGQQGFAISWTTPSRPPGPAVCPALGGRPSLWTISVHDLSTTHAAQVVYTALARCARLKSLWFKTPDVTRTIWRLHVTKKQNVTSKLFSLFFNLRCVCYFTLYGL